MAILISAKVDFKATKNITYEKIYNTIKHSTPKCICIKQQNFKSMKEKLIKLKGEIELFTIIVGNINIFQQLREPDRKSAN